MTSLNRHASAPQNRPLAPPTSFHTCVKRHVQRLCIPTFINSRGLVAMTWHAPATAPDATCAHTGIPP